MGERFLGVPRFLWGAGCLIVACLFAFVVPHPRGEAIGLRHFLLRWGHALIWVLLALFCFAQGARLGGPTNLLGLAAGLLYAAFLVTLLTRK